MRRALAADTNGIYVDARTSAHTLALMAKPKNAASPDEPRQQLGLRLSSADLRRIDDLAALLSKRAEGVEINRSAAARAALLRGLDAMLPRPESPSSSPTPTSPAPSAKPVKLAPKTSHRAAPRRSR